MKLNFVLFICFGIFNLRYYFKIGFRFNFLGYLVEIQYIYVVEIFLYLKRRSVEEEIIGKYDFIIMYRNYRLDDQLVY